MVGCIKLHELIPNTQEFPVLFPISAHIIRTGIAICDALTVHCLCNGQGEQSKTGHGRVEEHTEGMGQAEPRRHKLCQDPKSPVQAWQREACRDCVCALQRRKGFEFSEPFWWEAVFRRRVSGHCSKECEQT